ncbi:LLM class flavin-dependent oxidoreductase [Pengzhenrongella phosphoraccumulans]|uniref:LLM class flavin-dependent oxidoreductase n=1 Tax=Pengzhenrongella phosphoraccumulans TaxID=3114394 RepID=UPI00388EDFC3
MPASIGVMLPRDLPAAQVVDYLQAAERAGFDEVWVVEDCFFRGAIAQAAVALASTTTIRVGIGIMPAAGRNPAITALETSTLAALFPGRTIVGIGHGMPAWMRQIGGWPASPLALLEETLDAVRGLLRGETLTTAGRYVRLTDVTLDDPPQVVPPVLAGVRGPRSLELAGRHADGTILAEPVTPEYLAVAATAIDAAGPHLVVAYNVAAVDDDASLARAVARTALEWIGEADWAVQLAPLDFADELAALRGRASSRAEFAASLPDEWVDRLAVVGTPAQARARIDELHRAGADSVVLIPAGPDPFGALQALGRLL